MAHIAVFCMPEPGHVYPALGLMAELARRGHRVSCPTTDRFTTAIESTGARPVRYESTFPDVLPASLYEAARLVYTETIATLPVLEKTFAADPPEAVLWDIGTWSGALLARRLGVPDLQLGSILGSNQYWSLGQAGIDLDWGKPDVVRFFTDVHTYFGGPLPEFMALSRRRIALFPREFQYEGDTFDDQFVFAGPCLTDRAFQGSWRPPEHDRPVVLAKISGYEQECADAVRDMPWHLVLVGRPPDRLPPNVEVHRSVPQLSVLTRASAFLTRGGMAGVMEALVLGVPMVVVPRMADQQLNGQRVEELGLGVVLDCVTPEGLRSLLQQVMTDPSICARIKDMQSITQSTGGAQLAADAVEAELR